ncbi:hypothetical protein ACHQM5_005246 [Ranunculus cassubicifolius]
MSNPYDSAKTGRLIFKGGIPASHKSIDKKKHKKKKSKSIENPSIEPQIAIEINGDEAIEAAETGTTAAAAVEDVYSIDAAKKMKYDELFPVEAKKFRYDPKEKASSVEKALDDRVKKKADRYCK